MHDWCWCIDELHQDRYACQHANGDLQAEGEKLSRKNGELEATVRKLRHASRDVEQDRERQQTRMAALESQLAQEQARSRYAGQEAAQQVCVPHVNPCVLHCTSIQMRRRAGNA